jgi:hypothetical protein
MRIDYKKRRERIAEILGGKEAVQIICDLVREKKMSPPQIAEKLRSHGVQITNRSVQRIVSENGFALSVGEAYRLAMEKGRMRWPLKDPRLKVKRRITPKTRMAVFERDSFRCLLCGRDAKETVIEVDHIIPLTQGGSDEMDNLRTLCHECNVGKRITNREI